jgi:anaerobic selenocysteine-containing dehydrogenase
MWVSNHEVNARPVLTEIKRDPTRNLIVVDVIKTKTAKMADHFVQIKPGTDFWFLRSLVKMLVDNNFVNWSWIQKNTVGYENIDRVVDFNLDDYLAICGVSYEQLFTVAQVIGQSNTVVVKAELGINHTPNPLANYYLLSLIWILRGSYNCKGGMIPQPSIPSKKKFSSIKPVTRYTQQPCSMGGGVPAAVVPAELPHYRTIIVNQSNPINHMPGKVEFTETFNAAELKIVFDCVLTETAKLADYVLPTPAYYQKYDIVGGVTTNPTNLQLKRPIYDTYGQRTVYDIVNMLAEYFTTPDHEFTVWHSSYMNSPYETPVIALLETLLSFSYPNEQVQDHIQRLIATDHIDVQVDAMPDIKLNLTMSKLNLDNPDCSVLVTDPDYPFILAAGYRRHDSTGMDVLNQNKLTVEIHPLDAKILGIVEKEIVCISTRNGSILAECVLNDDLQAGYIRTPTNRHLNMLTSNAIKDKLNPMYKINHARVDKVSSN